MKIDAILGLSLGDEGKGKICANLIQKNKYDYCLRFAGGANAGHTIYVNDKKVATHIIPTGAVFGVKSIIGPGCVLSPISFFQELKELSLINSEIEGIVRIAYNAHIVTSKHIEEEAIENKIGTTKRGIGPAYRDKYARTGIRAESIPELKPFIVDMYDEFSNNPNASILAEGAQGLGLDIDMGDYPFVTSSNCGIGGLLNNGFKHTDIRHIYGVVKAYTTYVGSKSFQNKSDPILDMIADLGAEFGTTTGRRRQINYFDIQNLIKSLTTTSVNTLIINKVDILQKIGCWKLIDKGVVVDCENEEKFKNRIISIASQYGVKEVIFSYSPNVI